MKDHTVEIKHEQNIKVIRINIENGKGMVIKRDTNTNQIISVTDESGKDNPEIIKGQPGQVKLDGKEIVDAYPEDIVIFTHSSPGCAYYWDPVLKRYIWRCT